MIYLKRFLLPNRDDEDEFVLSYPYQLEMSCFSHTNIYPFRVFPQKEFSQIDFAPITIFYGGNGSGKSTLLNVIAEKLELKRSSSFNDTPYMVSYLDLCNYELNALADSVPKESTKITSDDVFNFLLDTRAINQGIDKNRTRLFAEYSEAVDRPMQKLGSLEEFEAFKLQREAKTSSKSQYVTRRLANVELEGRSNGESAYLYFTQKIKENALYLLDEPENSLSASLQLKLMRFIEDSARFYGCQFVISTHSPFLLAMKGAKIYDLDRVPADECDWTELENVRVYHDFFKAHADEFVD